MDEDISKILESRYAKGEITKKEYLKMKDELNQTNHEAKAEQYLKSKGYRIQKPVPAWAWIVTVIVLIFFVIVFLMFLNIAGQAALSKYQCEQSFWYQVGLKSC